MAPLSFLSFAPRVRETTLVSVGRSKSDEEKFHGTGKVHYGRNCRDVRKDCEEYKEGDPGRNFQVRRFSIWFMAIPDTGKLR